MSTYTIWVNIEHQDECHEEHDEGLPDKLGVFTSLDEAAAHLRRLTGWNDPFLCNERDSDFRLDDDEEERPVTPYLAGRLEEEEETNEQLRAEIKVLKELLDLEHVKCNTCWAECKKVSCCCPPPLPAPHRGRSPE